MADSERKEERERQISELALSFCTGTFAGGKETPSQNENRRMLKEQIADRQTGVSLLRETYAGEDLNLTMGVLRQGEKCSSDIMLCLVHAGFIK